MRQIRQNVRSTSTPQATDTPPTPSEVPTEPLQGKVRQNMVTVECFEVNGNFFTDQTGRFPNKSSRGMQYIMVGYDHDSNAILTQTLKTRSEHEILRAMTALHTYLT